MLIQIQEESNEIASPPVRKEQNALLTELLSGSAIEPHTLNAAEMASLEGRLASKNITVRSDAEQQLHAMDTKALTAFLSFGRQNRTKRIKKVVICLITVY